MLIFYCVLFMFNLAGIGLSVCLLQHDVALGLLLLIFNGVLAVSNLNKLLSTGE